VEQRLTVKPKKRLFVIKTTPRSGGNAKLRKISKGYEVYKMWMMHHIGRGRALGFRNILGHRMKHMRKTLSMLLILGIATTACGAGEKNDSSQTRKRGESCPSNASVQMNKSFLEDFGIKVEFFEKTPKDVQCFVENAAMCEHLAGEEPYDEKRGKEVAKAMKKYCSAAQSKLKILDTKYNDQATKKILSVCKGESSAICRSFDPRELDE